VRISYVTFLRVKAGVRQEGVLSPILFGIYFYGLVNLVDKTNIGCKIAANCTGIFLYADDIILLAPCHGRDAVDCFSRILFFRVPM